MLGFKRIVAGILLVCAIATLVPAQAFALPVVDAEITAPSVDEPAAALEQAASFVRYSANFGSTVIGCLENGTNVTVLGTYGSFYRIDCYDMTGYIAISQVAQSDNGEYYVNCVADSSETKVLKTFSPQEALSLKGQVRTFSLNYQGVPYVSGGTSPRGFDCCGFTQYVYNNLGFSISRTVAAQLQDGVIVSKNDLQCGDLIFFQNTTGWGHFASHVGIYIGNGQMIHSGSGGVAVVNLEHAYYEYHYLCARRVILSDLSAQTVIPAVGINQNINSSYWRETSQTEPGLGNSFAQGIASM